jgi:hypothetical protein
LAANLRTAKALGLSVPLTLQVAADMRAEQECLSARRLPAAVLVDEAERREFCEHALGDLRSGR